MDILLNYEDVLSFLIVCEESEFNWKYTKWRILWDLAAYTILFFHRIELYICSSRLVFYLGKLDL